MSEEEIKNSVEEDNELEPKKKSTKDKWLFFIFLDIIALCVLGFFVYTTFFEGLNVPVDEDIAPGEGSRTQQPFLEEIFVEDVKTDIKSIAAQPQEPAAPVVKPVEPPKPAAVKEPAKPVEAAKRQSVTVSGTGKTRTVTFKYFGDAKSAAVVGGFTMRKPVAMKKVDGEWHASVIIYPGEYRYRYIIDGKEIPDPNAEKQEDGRSVLIVK